VIAAQSIDDHEDDQWVALRIEAHLDARLRGEEKVENS
jgi:hypothetical protein